MSLLAFSCYFLSFFYPSIGLSINSIEAFIKEFIVLS